jgi:hypothetical protein
MSESLEDVAKAKAEAAALAKAKRDAFARAWEASMSIYDPHNIESAVTLAAMLAKSQILPRHLHGKPADVLAIMIKGRELGISTMKALSGMYCINGKVELDAATLAGVVMSRTDLCEYLTLIESTDKVATYETKRKGSPKSVVMGFTMVQAERAGLLRNDVWRKFPEAMLRARAISVVARAVYPDLAAGLYVQGEIGGDDPKYVPATSQVEAKPTRPAFPVTDADFEVIRESLKTPPVAEDEVAEPAPAARGTWTDSEPDFSPDDKISAEAARENQFAGVKMSSGPLKGQFVSAQPLAWLVKAAKHLQTIVDLATESGQPQKVGNIKMLEALAYYIEKKSAEDYTDAEINAAQEETK